MALPPSTGGALFLSNIVSRLGGALISRDKTLEYQASGRADLLRSLKCALDVSHRLTTREPKNGPLESELEVDVANVHLNVVDSLPVLEALATLITYLSLQQDSQASHDQTRIDDLTGDLEAALTRLKQKRLPLADFHVETHLTSYVWALNLATSCLLR